ncbi:hypothetical protein MUP95_05220, partial [bacterium]|nr:hypothetical protein [bacterium]
MHVYLFHNSNLIKQYDIHQEDIFRILNDISSTTDTTDLVVALYLIPGYRQNRGTAYVRRWMT